MNILNFQQSLDLFDPKKTPLHDLGIRADELRQEKCGNTVFFNVNAHINPTNVCQYRCALCAFSTDSGTPRA